MNITILRIAAVIASILVLAGCGGGGGSGGPSPTDMGERIIPSSSADLQSAARTAANARAKFGSVTQSSNVANGATTDSASASFNGSRLTFQITRSDGSVESFGPPSAVVPDFSPPAPDTINDNSGMWTLLGQRSGNSASIAFVAANWNQQAAQSEWLAQGIWIKTGDVDNPSPQNIEIGTFVDGPEIESDADLSGLSITDATYSGTVSGIYVATGGNELGRGIFNSRVSLTANFDDNTIDGCVGCSGGLNLQDDFDVSSPVNYPYRFRLGEATIRDNGRVEAGAVTVETGLDTQVTTSSGSWSGRFSNRNVDVDGSQQPRAVAGTVGSSFTIGAGTEAENIVFVGSFLSPPTAW